MKNRPEFLILLNELENRLKKCNVELSACPKGTLQKTISNGKQVFFQGFTDADNKMIRKSLYHKPEVARSLARKAYLEAEVKALERNLTLLQKMLNDCPSLAPDEIISSLPKRYQGIPTEWFFDGNRHGNDTFDGWDTEPYTKSDFHPEELTKITTRGLHVRSMAELAIAERFYYHQLMFRYEELINIDGYKFTPDFTIMRRRDGKLFYWEHCGLPHDEKYMGRHKWKLSMYEKAGIVPWDNLIVTYGDRNANVDMRIVESEIVNKLI